MRTDEFSARFEAQLADENELKHLFDRRKLVREHRQYLVDRARKRFDVYIHKKHADLSGNTTKTGPVLEVNVVPRFPSRQICKQELLQNHVLKNYMSWRRTLFPDFTRRQLLWQHESILVLDAAVHTSLFEVNVWGAIFYGVELELEHVAEQRGVHPYEVAGYVLLFVQHASKMFQVLGYSGPLLIETSLSSILRVPWLHFVHRSVAFASSESELDDEVAFSIATSGDGLMERPDRLAIDILRSLFFSVNWPGLVDTAEHAENLIRLGYEFNSWPAPASLRR